MIEAETQKHTGKIILKSQSQAAAITKSQLEPCLV